MRWMPFVLSVTLLSPVTLAQAPANNVIEEVIVTVTKRAESVQDVSASVNAYGGVLTDDFNIDDADKIGEILPNINVRNQSNITIRGIGRGLTNGSPVATHENGFFVQDGVTVPYYDIAAIEVLRGPECEVVGPRRRVVWLHRYPPCGERPARGASLVEYTHQRKNGGAHCAVSQRARRIIR